MNRRFLMFAAFAALPLAACSGAHSGHAMKDSGPMAITDAVVQPPLPGRDIALGTFSLTNRSGAADVLLSAGAPISSRVEIHTHIKEGDVMKMRRLDSLALGDGETVIFKSGGYHLMMFGAQLSEDLTSVPVTLTFQNAGPVTVNAAIAGRDDSGHSHMDHSGH